MIRFRELTGAVFGGLDDWRALTAIGTLLGVLIWIQALREKDRHAAARGHMDDFEPVLGGSPLSFLTVPLYRALRLVCVDLLSKHACFVAATGWMVHQHVENLTGFGVIASVSLVVIHLLAWVNWIFPDQRVRFLDAVIEVIRAVPAWWSKPSSSSPYQMPPTDPARTSIVQLGGVQPGGKTP